SYRKFLHNVVRDFGGNMSSESLLKQMDEIIDFEKELSRISLTTVERKDKSKLYHRMSPTNLSDIFPMFPWLKIISSVIDTTDITQ
ncbi:Uncharacterized protein FKW44_009613, partial [Caligus rogercresseyi]